MYHYGNSVSVVICGDYPDYRGLLCGREVLHGVTDMEKKAIEKAAVRFFKEKKDEAIAKQRAPFEKLGCPEKICLTDQSK